MVNLSFHKSPAGNEVFEAGTRMLLVEAGPAQLTALLWNLSSKTIDGIEVFSGISNWEADFPIMLQLSQLLNFRELETEVVFNSEWVLPVPAFLYEKDSVQQQLSVLYPETREALYFGGDVLPGQEMIMCWEAPEKWVRILRDHFAMVRFQSIATLLLKVTGLGQNEMQEGLLVIADPWAWVVFRRSGQLLCIRPLPILYPDDVSYFLLNLGKQWGVEPAEISWRVAGMIEPDAPLWQSPYRFFEQFHLWEGEKQSDEIPAHFFAHYLQYLSSR